jgi:aldehyde:ferredoxin oxidoreductase
MALWKEGIITKDDTGGIEVTEGNEDAIMELTRQIAYREGFGDILADFPVKAAQRLGRNSDRYASHTKGQFAWIPGHGIGITLIYTMSLNVNTRGYDHLMGGMSMFTPNLRAEFGITEDLLTRLMVLADMMGTCKFGTRYNQPVTGIYIPEWRDFLSAATGQTFTEEDLMAAARRVIALERCYNAREGIRRIDDYPFYLWWQKKHGKPHPIYTTMRGHDLKTGIPTRSELKRCGLQDVSEDLHKRKILT